MGGETGGVFPYNGVRNTEIWSVQNFEKIFKGALSSFEEDILIR